MIDATIRIAVTLTAAEWNQVLALVRDLPAPDRITDPLLRAMHGQCMAASENASNVTQLRDLNEAGG